MVFRMEYAEETNQKQKIRKLQNENICLTNLNVANNGNFPILAFSKVTQIKIIYNKKEVCLVKTNFLK